MSVTRQQARDWDRVRMVRRNPNNRTMVLGLSVIVLAAVSLRLFLWNVYQPISYPDTSTYVDLAHRLTSGNWIGYEGRRTPVYPLFLIATGSDPWRVWSWQSALGVATAVVLFLMVYRRTERFGPAMAAGLLQTVSLNQVFLEANVVSETLATFLLLLSIASFRCLLPRARRTSGPYALLGILVAAVGLTKPLFLYLGPLLFVLLPLVWPDDLPTRAKVRYGLSYAVPFGCVVLAWSAVNYTRIGYFGPTTLGGYNLTQHSGAFMEKAPDRFATIRDIYLEFRQRRQAEAGTHSMTIWDAYPTMERTTGLPFADLSRELTKMSLIMFARHPFLYMRTVLAAAFRFWTVANYWRPQAISSAPIRAAFQRIWLVQRAALRGVNALFLACSGLLLWHLRRSARRPAHMADAAVAIAVLIGCVVQAMTEYGENARYALPYYPLILYVTTVTLWDGLQSMRPWASPNDRDSDRGAAAWFLQEGSENPNVRQCSTKSRHSHAI